MRRQCAAEHSKSRAGLKETPVPGRYRARTEPGSGAALPQALSHMLQIIGSVVVIGCILGGFVAEGGHILALWHPFELVIIVGSAIGAFLISNPMKVVKAAFAGAVALPKGPRYKRADYVTPLPRLYDILVKIGKE